MAVVTNMEDLSVLAVKCVPNIEPTAMTRHLTRETH